MEYSVNVPLKGSEIGALLRKLMHDNDLLTEVQETILPVLEKSYQDATGEVFVL